MRVIRILLLVLSITLLASFVGGCSPPLAGPKGPNSSLVMGRVVIENQDPEGDLPMGNVQKGINLAIESRDELQFARVVTRDGGYFMIPNIPPGPYYVVPLFSVGDDSRDEDTGNITAIHEVYFAPVPGKIVDLGTFFLRISENYRLASNFVSPDPELTKAHFLKEYPQSRWLTKEFVSGSIRRVYSHRGKGYRFAGPPLKDWQRSQARFPDIQFEHNAGGGWIGVGGFKLRSSVSFSKVNEWWVNAVSTERDWTNIKILEEKDLTLAGLKAKLVAFEFTNKLGGKQIERTYHIYNPGKDHDLFRIRMNSIKDRYEWFLPAVQKVAESFDLI
jgi:hypothetical protein